jgi:hypothetical protein
VGEEVRRGRELIKARQNTSKTSPGGGAITLRLREDRQSNLIHMFDAAGEDYSEALNYEKPRFLDDSQGLAYVLDPFSVQAVREQLGGQQGEVLAAAQAAENDPDLAYGEVISRLRDGGVPVSTQRLAVVISKAALLRDAGIDIPTKSETIGDWLVKVGLQNLKMATTGSSPRSATSRSHRRTLPPSCGTTRGHTAALAAGRARGPASLRCSPVRLVGH